MSSQPVPASQVRTRDDLPAYVKSRLAGHPPLNLHLVSAHANGAGLGMNRAEALDSHDHEHTGPGTIRNHDRNDLFWDADKVALVIIECAEGDDLADTIAEIDRLMTPDEERILMAPDAHTHDFTPGQDWQVCADGVTCTVYPRIYDIATTRDREGRYGSCSYSTITNEADDIARCLVDARSALVFMDVAHENDGLGVMARDALARLNTAVSMLHPRLYPHYLDR